MAICPHLEAGSEHDPINLPPTAVVQPQSQPVAHRSRRLDVVPKRQPDLGGPRDQPGRRRRADAPVCDPISQRRYAAEGIGHGDKPAQPDRADVGRRIEDPAPAAFAGVQPATPTKPADSVRPRNDLDVGSGFMEQRGQLDCALPGADDRGSQPGEAVELSQLRGVLNQRRGKVRELHRASGEAGGSRRDHHPSGGECLAVVEVEVETAARPIHPGDASAVDVRDSPALVPTSVLEVVLKWHRPG